MPETPKSAEKGLPTSPAASSIPPAPERIELTTRNGKIEGMRVLMHSSSELFTEDAQISGRAMRHTAKAADAASHISLPKRAVRPSFVSV